MTHRWTSRTKAATVLLAVGLLLSSCDRPTGVSIVYEASSRDYGADAARKLLSETDTASIAGLETEGASEHRRDALVALRSKGAGGEVAATLITSVFPADTPAVPARVLTATYEGRPAVILVEAYGDDSGRLARKRLWVLARTSGAILFAAASR